MTAFRQVSTLIFYFIAVHCHASDSFLSLSTDTSTDLLKDLEAIMGVGSVKARLDKLKARILPTFLSLPKGSGDLLNHPTTHYALHRILASQHGWTINSMTPIKSSFNATSLVASGLLNGFVPLHVLAVFEKHISTQGFSLEHLTILASTIEYFIHDDQKWMLRDVCQFFGVPTSGPMPDDDMTNLVKVYMAVFLQYVTNEDIQHVETFGPLFDVAADSYSGWDDTALLVVDERENLGYNERHQMSPFRLRESSMNVALRVVEQVADHFTAKVVEPGCQEIKEDLLEYERADTGRLLLADFYRAGLDSRFFFVESKEYLRATGALDETDSILGPKVMIPNYVQAKSNCLAKAHTYSVCCINECENLYGHLERGISAKGSSPARIAHLVKALPSSTVQAPRNLSQGLLLRLDEIAAAHGGDVALHSRLFAQWMHQAFPRECRYPHLAGTLTSLSPDEWVKQTGFEYRIDYRGESTARAAQLGNIEALDKEYNPSVNQASIDVDGEAELMWTSEDEQLDEPRQARSLFWLSNRTVVLCVVLLGLKFVTKLHSLSIGRDRKQLQIHTVHVV